jgi:hypothetical protein
MPNLLCPHPYGWQEPHQQLDHSQKLHLIHLEEDQPITKEYKIDYTMIT